MNTLTTKIIGFFAFLILALNPIAAAEPTQTEQQTTQQENQDTDLEIIEDDEVMADED